MKDLQWMKDQLEKDYADGKRVQSRIKDGEKIEGIDIKSYWRGSQTANYIARCYLEDLDEPEVLSQEFIDKYKVDYDNWMPAVPIVHLQNLLVPKQEEITEEQAWEVIRGKYGDEVLQNNIDYVESQGYVVIEKPTVPQFVADWHVQNKYYLLGAKFERIADSEDKRVVDWYGRCSGRHKNNRSNAQETIALMDLVGYEVEEEPQYRLKAGDNYLYFNLDGTARGATKKNAVITKERLEQLPFDVEKAVESGIIEVEELEE